MKKIATRALFVLIALFQYTNANSQAIKIDFLGYSGVCDYYGTQMFWGVGYDQNLGEKISLGLTYKSGYAIDEESNYHVEDYSFTTLNYGVVKFDVTHTTQWHEFSFTSKYFFSDNSDASYFVSSGLSMLLATNQYDISSLSVGGTSVPLYGDLREGTYAQDITLFPVSVDLGHRGDIDGLYFEIYTGVSFMPFGSSPDVEPASLANYGVETKFKSFSFHVGMSLGFGWPK